MAAGKGPALTAPQREFLERFFADETVAPRFCLVGGTALAGFHLHHRRSEDLDLFCTEPDAPLGLLDDAFDLVEKITTSLGWRVDRQGGGRRHLRLAIEIPGVEVRELRRIDLALPWAPFLEPPELHGTVRVAALRDLALGKLIAAAERPALELKDVVDLHALEGVPGIRLVDLVDRARVISPRFSPLELASRVTAVPHLESQWVRFRKDYLFWDDLRFSDLLEFGRRLAREIDLLLGPPAG